MHKGSDRPLCIALGLVGKSATAHILNELEQGEALFRFLG